MDETGGDIFWGDDVSSAQQKSDRRAGEKSDGKVSESIKSSDTNNTITASAQMYVHAKNPERVRSEWLR